MENPNFGQRSAQIPTEFLSLDMGIGVHNPRGPAKFLSFPLFPIINFYFKDEILDLCPFYSPHVFNSCLQGFWEALPGTSKPKGILESQGWGIECVAVLEM